MKFNANRKIMREYLKSMIKVVPKSNPVKELNGFLIEANEDDGYLYMTATNFDVAVQRKFKTDIESGGSFVMDAKFLVDILGALGGDVVDFEEKANGIVDVKSEDCVYTLQVMDSAEYPRPEIPFPDSTVNVVNLSKAYKKTFSTVANDDETLQVLKGIHVELKDGKMRVISCNRRNVAMTTQKVKNGMDFNFTLSKDSFFLLASVAGDSEVEMGECGKRIVFMKEGMLFSTKQLQSQYINVDMIFNNLDTEYVATADFDELREQILQICDIATLGLVTSYINFNFNDNELKMSTQNNTGTATNSVKITPVQGNAEKAYYYSANALKDVLKTVEGKLVFRLDKNGYLNVMDMHSQYLITSIPEDTVLKQLKKYEEYKAKKTKNEKADKKNQKSAA